MISLPKPLCKKYAERYCCIIYTNLVKMPPREKPFYMRRDISGVHLAPMSMLGSFAKRALLSLFKDVFGIVGLENRDDKYLLSLFERLDNAYFVSGTAGVDAIIQSLGLQQEIEEEPAVTPVITIAVAVAPTVPLVTPVVTAVTAVPQVTAVTLSAYRIIQMLKDDFGFTDIESLDGKGRFKAPLLRKLDELQQQRNASRHPR
jgi:hypothetical protein